MHICVCSLELADKCVPGHWPEESEAKLGHLVLQPGTDQSAGLPLAVVFFPLPIWTHISTHALTDRPRLSVQSQQSRDGLCEAAMLEATGSTHCSTMTCWLYFSIQGRIWCHPSPLCVENEIRLFEPFSSVRIHYGEFEFTNSLVCRRESQLWKAKCKDISQCDVCCPAWNHKCWFGSEWQDSVAAAKFITTFVWQILPTLSS